MRWALSGDSLRQLLSVLRPTIFLDSNLDKTGESNVIERQESGFRRCGSREGDRRRSGIVGAGRARTLVVASESIRRDRAVARRRSGNTQSAVWCYRGDDFVVA